MPSYDSSMENLAEARAGWRRPGLGVVAMNRA
jgi:hypothetical protein